MVAIEGYLLLMMGGYDCKIHVYTVKRGSDLSELKFRFSMLGHLNSIKDLAIS